MSNKGTKHFHNSFIECPLFSSFKNLGANSKITFLSIFLNFLIWLYKIFHFILFFISFYSRLHFMYPTSGQITVMCKICTRRVMKLPPTRLLTQTAKIFHTMNGLQKYLVSLSTYLQFRILQYSSYLSASLF